MGRFNFGNSRDLPDWALEEHYIAANPAKEQWYIKDNGGSGESVGIASTHSNWFIAENVLRDNAELICRLFNSYQTTTQPAAMFARKGATNGRIRS